ncbi:MAG: hypothetical protein RSC96_00775 [Oscillospiraceae bacterium]
MIDNVLNLVKVAALSHSDFMRRPKAMSNGTVCAYCYCKTPFHTI